MFETLLEILKGTGIPFVAYDWDQAPASGSYGVVSLDGSGDSELGDNRINAQAIRGSIDLFCRNVSTAEARLVQNAINGVVAWNLSSVQYETDTHIVHFEWTFEMEGL